jgi:hypothetical protein
MNQHTAKHFFIFKIILFEIILFLFVSLEDIKVLFHIGIENVGNEEFSEFDFLVFGEKIQKVAFFGFEDG